MSSAISLFRAQLGVTITATRRHSRQLRRQYDAQRRAEGAHVWEAPDILSYPAWLTRLWRERAAVDPVHTPVLLSRVQEDALWQQAIHQLSPADYLLDVPATAAMSARAWNLLHEWELPRERGAFGDSEDCQAFFDWSAALESKLAANGWITHAQIAAELSHGAFPAGISCAGFDQLTPAQRRLFRAARATETVDSAPLAEARVKRVCARDATAELEQAAVWARAQIEEAQLEKSSGPASVAVLIPGLASLSAKAERVFDDILHPGLNFARSNAPVFHIASGTRADEVPWIATALLILGLRPGLTLPEAGRLLRSPALALDRVSGASLDARLRHRRLETITFDSVRDVFPQLAQQAAKMMADAPPAARPSAWSSVFSNLMASVEWSARIPTSPERRAMDHWKDLLSTLASLDVVSPRISYEQAVARLHYIARESTFSAIEPEEGDDAPIQIMDLREGAESSLLFDAVWIAGLQESAWPEPVKANPFLPLALQRAVGVPGSSAELAVTTARRVLQRLVRSAPEVVCSFAQFAGEEELRPTPLLAELPAIEKTIAEPDTVLRRVFASAGLIAKEEHPAHVFSGAARHEFTGGAGLLQDQAACPFRAFAVHRLGARELDQMELGVSPRERGNAVHIALEFFWKQIKSQAELKALSADQLTSLIERAADKGLETNDAPERFRMLERKRLMALLCDWLVREVQRPSFTIVESEKDRVAEVGGIVLKIRPDRIDRYEDGSLAIIDYKTAMDLKEKQWDGERPIAPQLPLYATDRGSEVSEVMFAQLLGTKSEIISRNGAALQNSLPEWKRVLQKLAVDFADGNAVVDPNLGRKTCAFCKLKALCRISELGIAAGEEESED